MRETAGFSQYFADISSTNWVWKNPPSAFKRARLGLQIDTSELIHRPISGETFKTTRFFTNFPDFAHLWNLNTGISFKLDNDKKMILYNYKGSRDPWISRHLNLHSTVIDNKQWKKPKIWRFYQFWISKNRRWKKRRFYGYSPIHFWVFDKISFFSDSPQVQKLVTGSESGSGSESETETTHLLLRRLSWTAVGYPLAKGSLHVIFYQTPWFSQSFSKF